MKEYNKLKVRFVTIMQSTENEHEKVRLSTVSLPIEASRMWMQIYCAKKLLK